MKPATYPFAAIVGQEEMKLALLLAAVDWRLGVLLRGDKGSGKTTAARGLASLLPKPAPFINLPIGATEDRLLGGLHIERMLKGDPILKPGLLSEAHGGVLYVDEVNLLPAHLGDALLDAAASGIHVVEREGFSASQAAEFVLLGSMNPEEGSLRPQLLDRFALSVTISAPTEIAQRQIVIERRIDFERDPKRFVAGWSEEESALRKQIEDARESLRSIVCSTEILQQVCTLVCEKGGRSLRTDLAVMRAAIAYAALAGEKTVKPDHVEAVLPLALGHRIHDNRHPPQPPKSVPPAPQKPTAEQETSPKNDSQKTVEHIFVPHATEAPALRPRNTTDDEVDSASGKESSRGPATSSRRSDDPQELDLRATLAHTLQRTGSFQPLASDLHERIRTRGTGVRYLFVIDSSGSHAVRERMRLVKGAALSLLSRSFKRGDEVAIIVFRGTSAEVSLEPTSNLADAVTTLEYLPTGGRTPLAHGLQLAKSYVSPKAVLILMTDGHANYPLHDGDAWQEALEEAAGFGCAALVVDTETSANPIGHAETIANVLQARCVGLEALESVGDLTIELFATRSKTS